MLIILAFVLAIASDAITVAWHSNRDRGNVYTTSILSGVLELLTWVPIIGVVWLDDWRIAAVSILGSVIGTFFGMRKPLKQLNSEE